MDDRQEMRLLEVRTKTLETQMAIARSDIEGLQAQSRGQRADLDRLVLMVIGDEDLGLRGIVERIKGLEDLIRGLSDDRQSGSEHSGAIMLILSLIAVFTLSTLILVMSR